jgi:hypothetical protein
MYLRVALADRTSLNKGTKSESPSRSATMGEFAHLLQSDILGQPVVATRVSRC